MDRPSGAEKRMSRVRRPRTTTCCTSYSSAPDSASTPIRPAVIPGRSVPWTRHRIVELLVTRSVWLRSGRGGKARTHPWPIRLACPPCPP